MRVALAVVVALALGGCRSDEELAGPDLSSASLYCPPSPPTVPSICDPTAIPYCTYPAQQVTCRCMGIGGEFVLVCPPPVVDGGTTRD